ncbi:hypothetical protein BHU72_07085 [Desulfuribacillus stibiiarsenatis]|uniref:ABC transporter domain-containing protein n=1 Tax=Desulfuribacillus stibiiarsenatis TaxID=1390249 RepID=A0A1E5L4P7_9FIRM|nr:ATP-binding cassette domain-containing protein [Desulfuribacillus stibiiarsenatis]OEH84949.1 hypothetical protein BHU72_07085 [Desulfuribacillus stibiiarsenatis]
MLQVDIKTHGYKGNKILNNISHTFLTNKIHGIIGPNGSGKSTLLKVIAGIERPQEGNIFFQGVEMLQPHQEIACCWQKPYLFHGSVRYNLEYGMKVRGWSRPQRDHRIGELVHDYQLEKLLDRSVQGLSGGETSRVAIARAVSTNPKLLILDEPSAALDPQNVMFVESMLKNLRESSDITIIMVTHNMFQAKRIADETVFLSGGTIVEVGNTMEMFAAPFHEETRSFISGDFIY